MQLPFRNTRRREGHSTDNLVQTATSPTLYTTPQRSECTAALAHRPSSECILPTTVLKRAPPVAMAATDVPIARPKNHSKTPWFFEMDKPDGEMMRSESNWKWGI